MTAKSNTAKKPSSVAQWKKKAAGDLIELPSGLTLRIRRVGLQTIMATGIMPNSLLTIAKKAVDKGQGFTEPTDAELAGLVTSEKQIEEMLGFFNKLVCFIAAEPEIHPVPEPGVERDDDLVYVDEVDDEDKMFLFQVVTGGTTNLEQFRSEHGSKLDAVRGLQNLELPSE